MLILKVKKLVRDVCTPFLAKVIVNILWTTAELVFDARSEVILSCVADLRRAPPSLQYTYVPYY